MVEELWLAGAEAVAVNGERVTSSTAVVDIGGSVLVNSAYLAPPYDVKAIGPAPMYDTLLAAPGFVDFVRSRAETFGIGVEYAVLDQVDLDAYAGSLNLRYGRVDASPSPGVAASDAPPPRRPLMRRRSAQLAMTAVLFILGVLAVAQFNAQTADQGLTALSVSELTELVANVTTRNNQLREEIATLERQRETVEAAVARGDTSSTQIRSDLNRVLGWSGALPVTGSGIRITVSGAIPGDAIELLLNELRNAGAEAAAIGGVRIVPGRRRDRSGGRRSSSVACRSGTPWSSPPSASRRSSRARSVVPAARSPSSARASRTSSSASSRSTS